jgi:hypothetical protein
VKTSDLKNVCKYPFRSIRIKQIQDPVEVLEYFDVRVDNLKELKCVIIETINFKDYFKFYCTGQPCSREVSGKIPLKIPPLCCLSQDVLRASLRASLRARCFSLLCP